RGRSRPPASSPHPGPAAGTRGGRGATRPARRRSRRRSAARAAVLPRTRAGRAANVSAGEPFANVPHMSKILVVAEKPSVGRDLASALPGKFEKHEAYLESDEYVITWAVGHLVQLAEPEEYDEKWKKWRMADLPITVEQFKLVPRDAKSKKQLKAAARSRSEADWLVGMNATRAATIRGRAWVGGVVSLGRVQTPTLAIMVKREREIQAFTPEPYRLVHGSFLPKYEGIWFEGDETRIFKPLERADEIVARVSGQQGTITKLERKEQSERAPLLYDLTSLQREANRKYGFSARRTLQAAQSLYESKKAITYPRTSSRFLSGDMVPQLKIVA